MLKVHKVETFYGGLQVLKGASLEVGDHEIVSVIGSNGSGKSTLLKTISGFVVPTSGYVEFNGAKISGMEPDKIVKIGITQVPQTSKLFRTMTVKENLEMGAFVRKDKKGIAQDLELMYELFPILKEKSNKQAGTMSGGQQQMVGFARGLMADPKMLLLDEPSAGLSPAMIETIAEKIIEIKTVRKIPIILVEQNAVVALQICDRGYVLRLGALAVTGTGQELLHNDEVRKAYLGL